MKKNILLICGGDGSEHEISLISASYIALKLSAIADYNVMQLTLTQGLLQDNRGMRYRLGEEGKLIAIDDNSIIDIYAVVPCLHGAPGETGEFPALLDFYRIPYIGCDMQASLNCFNKITTKLYLNALELPNTPFVIVENKSEASLNKVLAYFDIWQDVYVKAACQGSSIGCYHVTNKEDLVDSIYEAFTFSNEVLVEQTIKHREIEVAAYEFDGQIIITNPGEILRGDHEFYTYEEKYNADSQTSTTLDPSDLSEEQIAEIKDHALRAFKGLHLRDLSRIDFFVTEDDVLINEINTFPGMTPISMFPKMLEHNGHDMTLFLESCIERAVARKEKKRLI